MCSPHDLRSLAAAVCGTLQELEAEEALQEGLANVAPKEHNEIVGVDKEATAATTTTAHPSLQPHALTPPVYCCWPRRSLLSLKCAVQGGVLRGARLEPL